MKTLTTEDIWLLQLTTNAGKIIHQAEARLQQSNLTKDAKAEMIKLIDRYHKEARVVAE
jgi:hypothetical protein